jgi:hypothetical protein
MFSRSPSTKPEEEEQELEVVEIEHSIADMLSGLRDSTGDNSWLRYS